MSTSWHQALTKTGSRDDALKHESNGGTGTDHFKENVANQTVGEVRVQFPDDEIHELTYSQPGAIKKKLNEALTGHELGRPTGENSVRLKNRGESA